MDVLAELAPAIRSVAEHVAPSVVRIGRHGGRGCAVVVAPGSVLTNAHNLRGRDTTVTFAGGRQERGEVAGVDVDGDLAVVTVETGDLAAVPWADADAQLGDPVFAVSRGVAGHHRVSFGTVSGTERAFRGPRGRRITGTLEHTAPLGRGSSGSPVTDTDGHLIGLNTHRLGDGFYLALPTDTDLRDRLAALRRGNRTERPRLGVGLAPASVARRLRRSVGLPERDGLLVRSVEDASAAHLAGISPGDLIVGVDDVETADADALYAVLDGGPSSVVVHLVRGADELDVDVALAEPEAT
jgi:serine protease Do